MSGAFAMRYAVRSCSTMTVGARGGKVAREILGAYKGAVQCDGYDAYDQFEKNDNITVYGCWAHARRYHKYDIIKRASAIHA